MPAGLDRPIVSPLLVGREACLEALGEALDQVRSGHGQTVWISGEAGVGKTRLLSALWERAAAHGFVCIVRGACFERDQPVPYAPFADAVRTVVDGLDPVRAVERVGPDVARLLPELGLAPSDDDPRHVRRRVIEGLIVLLKDLASRGPIVCAIEDLHWGDASSLEAFAIIARRLSEQLVLLVGTFRDDEGPPPLLALLSELDRARLASEVRLPLLDRHQVDQMLRAIFAAQGPPRASLTDHIFELTDGNPFFVEELLRSVVAWRGSEPAVDWDRLYVDDLKLPRTIEEAVRRRTRALGHTARQVVVLAATLGRRAAQTLAPGGSVMLVEPMAGETVEDNLNPVGQVFSGASVLVCSPHAVAEGGTPLGTLATQTELRAVADRAGLPVFRQVATTPFNVFSKPASSFPDFESKPRRRRMAPGDPDDADRLSRLFPLNEAKAVTLGQYAQGTPSVTRDRLMWLATADCVYRVRPVDRLGGRRGRPRIAQPRVIDMPQLGAGKPRRKRQLRSRREYPSQQKMTARSSIGMCAWWTTGACGGATSTATGIRACGSASGIDQGTG